MRKFFQEPAVAKPAVVALSADEQMEAMVASEESFQEFIQLEAENARAMEIAAGLENLAMVADHVKSASNTDLAFFDAGIDLALVGTGISSESIVPGLEDMEGSVISTESVKETVDKIWTAIKKVIENMWKQIQIFWGNLVKAAPGLKLRAEALSEKVAELGSASTDAKTFSAGNALKTLSVDGNLPKKGSDVIEGLSLVESIISDH